MKSRSLLRFRFRSFDSTTLDRFLYSFMDIIKRQGIEFSGPVLMPLKLKRFTVLRAVFVDKKSKEHFEMRIHTRLIDVYCDKKLNLLQFTAINLPAEIEVDIERKE